MGDQCGGSVLCWDQGSRGQSLLLPAWARSLLLPCCGSLLFPPSTPPLPVSPSFHLYGLNINAQRIGKKIKKSLHRPAGFCVVTTYVNISISFLSALLEFLCKYKQISVRLFILLLLFRILLFSVTKYPGNLSTSARS